MPKDDDQGSARERSERLATWVDRRLAQVIRVHAAVRDTTIREIVEEALVEWVESHPLSADDLTAAVSYDETGIPQLED
jgi:hypothetical protein